jgi:hypothetical protein
VLHQEFSDGYDKIISAVYFFLCDNWIYHLFNAVTFEEGPLQSKAVGPGTVPLVRFFYSGVPDDSILLGQEAEPTCNGILTF